MMSRPCEIDAELQACSVVMFRKRDLRRQDLVIALAIATEEHGSAGLRVTEADVAILPAGRPGLE